MLGTDNLLTPHTSDATLRCRPTCRAHWPSTLRPLARPIPPDMRVIAHILVRMLLHTRRSAWERFGPNRRGVAWCRKTAMLTCVQIPAQSCTAQHARLRTLRCVALHRVGHRGNRIRAAAPPAQRCSSQQHRSICRLLSNPGSRSAGSAMQLAATSFLRRAVVESGEPSGRLSDAARSNIVNSAGCCRIRAAGHMRVDACTMCAKFSSARRQYVNHVCDR